MDQRQTQELFLKEDVTLEQRWQALSLNVQTYYERWAYACGKNIVREGGVMGAENMMTISALDPLHIDEQVDHILDWYRGRHFPRDVICWYLLPTPPRELEAKLFARGFKPNWKPHWMWCDLRHLQDNFADSTIFNIQVIEDESELQVDDLPYYDTESTMVFASLHHTYPQHIWHLAAFQKQQIVGHCILNLTTGEWGVAGLFNMGVRPAARKQGIGTALTQAACELAQQRGCHHVVLNATQMGESIYRRVGFQSIGYGHTWYVDVQTLAALAILKDQVKFLEAIGRGDIIALDETSKHLEKTTLQKSLPSGLTPLDIAVHCHQPTSAAWLVEHGVRLDLISAWDLGWKEQIPSLLIEHPELVNVQSGDGGLTPLHVAVERNDIELVKLLLTIPNNLDLKDTEFESTALGWAKYLKHTESIALIEQHCASQKKLN